MIKKILGVVVILLAIGGIVLSIQIIAKVVEFGWYALFVSLFLVLVGVVIYRKGIAGVISSIDDATPKGMK